MQITNLLKPFYPFARPTLQLPVRTALKTLLSAGLVTHAHTGKPRTWVRVGSRPQIRPGA